MLQRINGLELGSYLTWEIGFTAREKKKPTVKRQKIELYDRLGFHKSVRNVQHERPQRRLPASGSFGMA